MRTYIHTVCKSVCYSDNAKISYFLALEILKKHYPFLWRSLPEDYMATLATVCVECSVSNGVIELITSFSTPDQCNQEILNYIIYITRGDDHMMAFCKLMEKLITNPQLSKIVGALRKGTVWT